MTDGTVRHIYPGEDPSGRLQAELRGERSHEPLASSRRATPRCSTIRAARGGRPPIRSFPAQHVAALPAAGWFDGAIVLIGADLPNQDTFRTPLSAAACEAVRSWRESSMHAQALAQLLDGSPLSGGSEVGRRALLVLARGARSA